MARAIRATPLELDAAVQALRAGELVAFPTETVYGLGANAQHAAAVRKVFEVKGRPASHPLIVHLDSVRFLHRWAREVSPPALRLAERFWPGPLTLVLPRAPNVLDLVTGGQDSVAVRVPAHPMAQQLLQAFGGGIAAPSANRYGHVSPTRAEHVREEFGEAVRIVLDGGECQVGLESTIVSCLGEELQLLRPGQISLAQLRQAAGVPVTEPGAARKAGAGAGAELPRVPGSAAAHYAPRTPLRLVSDGQIERLAGELARGGKRIGVLAQRSPLGAFRHVTWVNAGTRPDNYAHDLYANLRTLDKTGATCLLVQEVPADARWDAIRDRLARAAAATPATLEGLP